MVLFIAKNNYLVACSENKFTVLDLQEEKLRAIELPELKMPENLTNNQTEVLKNEKVVISTCAFSNCGQYFVTSTTNKQLVVYKNFEVIHNLTINRTASKVKFTESNDLVVADKTGDVYLYKLKTGEVTQILGHLSMILDVLTTKNDQYIITSDRDEKIRISHFPNSYNILSFCLGHEEFVLNIDLLDDKTLVSASGDGTIRFWDYASGQELNKINVNNFLDDQNLIKAFSDKMDKETVEINALPITSMKIKQFEGHSLIFCTLHLCKDLFIFKVLNAKNVELLHKVDFEAPILDFDVSENLFLLLKNEIQYFTYSKNFVKVEVMRKSLIDFFDLIKTDVENCCNSNENISVLYKRKFDNVQEYQERKKLRIEGKK